MPRNLAGKSAIVTGGGRGIGREVALYMANEGARILVVDPGGARDGSGADTAPAAEVVELIKERGGEAVACQESVASFEAAARIVTQCRESFGSVDILFNGAGVLRERMIFNMSEEEWDTVLLVHLKGTFNMCRHACVAMKDQKYGRIINVTSDAWRGTVGQCNYGAAKGGIVSLTRAIAREMGRFGVTCNALAPLAATRMTLDEGVKAGMKKRLEAGIITQERYDELMAMPGPQYVAPAAAWLASDAAADFNGQVLGASGGRVYIYSAPEPVRELIKEDQSVPWRLDDLIRLIPRTLLTGYVNPVPKAP